MDLKITPSGQTIVKPTALGPVANTDTKLLIYGLFQKDRVLAQDGEQSVLSRARYCVGGPAATECRTSTEAKTSSQDLNSHGCLPVNTRSSFLRITTLIDGLFQKNRVLAQDGMVTLKEYNESYGNLDPSGLVDSLKEQTSCEQ